MDDIASLLANNRAWADRMVSCDPHYFERLAKLQAPRYLWIGCSDSRVPANQIIGLAPGEVFVHRNVANLVVHTDLNCLSVVQFAVDELKVRHVVVVGHYGCGGVKAVLGGRSVGLADHWLRHLEDLRQVHHRRLGKLSDEDARADKLSELNVVEQVCHVAQLPTLKAAWAPGPGDCRAWARVWRGRRHSSPPRRDRRRHGRSSRVASQGTAGAVAHFAGYC